MKLMNDLLDEIKVRMNEYGDSNPMLESGQFDKEHVELLQKLCDDPKKFLCELCAEKYVHNILENVVNVKLKDMPGIIEYVREDITQELMGIYEQAKEDAYSDIMEDIIEPAVKDCLGLPSSVEIDASEIDSQDTFFADEAIANWLSDHYGYCVNDFTYHYMNSDCKDYYVGDIDWDIYQD